MPFAHWVNGSLCPLLQRTDQHSAGLARLQTETEDRRTCKQETKESFVRNIAVLPMRGKNSIYQVDSYKGAQKSRQIKLLCCKRNQDLVKQFFPLSFILSQEDKKTNSKKQNNHIGLGHIINPSTGVGFHWRRKLVNRPQSHKKVFQFICLCLPILIHHPRPSILDYSDL